MRKRRPRLAWLFTLIAASTKAVMSSGIPTQREPEAFPLNTIMLRLELKQWL
jgi:hypothetical protein